MGVVPGNTGTRSNMPAIDHVNRGTVELIRSFLRCNIALNRKTHSLHFSKIKKTSHKQPLLWRGEDFEDPLQWFVQRIGPSTG